MDAQSVVWFWDYFGRNGFDVVIDGGWAVDALLERQTRPHQDLDIALPASQAPVLRARLEEMGFRQIPWPDSWQHNYVLEDGQGRRIDLHAFELNPDGSSKLGVDYTAEQLQGRGRILDREVRCITPSWLVKFHTGYPLDEDDWHDVQLLCERFDLPIPKEYDRFRDSGG